MLSAAFDILPPTPPARPTTASRGTDRAEQPTAFDDLVTEAANETPAAGSGNTPAPPRKSEAPAKTEADAATATPEQDAPKTSPVVPVDADAIPAAVIADADVSTADVSTEDVATDPSATGGPAQPATAVVAVAVPAVAAPPAPTLAVEADAETAIDPDAAAEKPPQISQKHGSADAAMPDAPPAEATATGTDANAGDAPVATKAAPEIKGDGSKDTPKTVAAPVAPPVKTPQQAAAPQANETKTANSGSVDADAAQPKDAEAKIVESAADDEADARTEAKSKTDADPKATARDARPSSHVPAPATPPDTLSSPATPHEPGPTNSAALLHVTQPHALAVVSAAHTQTAPQGMTQPVAVPLAGVAFEIAAQARAGNSRFEIRLDPPELGRIDVRLDVDRHGHVTSRLSVERIETLNLLRRDAPQLERALQDAGLKTGDSGLQFSLRDQSFAGRDERQPHGRAQHFVLNDEETQRVDAAARLYGRATGASGIDIRV